jgi:hypothetical protein
MAAPKKFLLLGTIEVIKSRKMGLGGHVARMGIEIYIKNLVRKGSKEETT